MKQRLRSCRAGCRCGHAFAQVKLFSIDSTLKDIRDELKKANGERPAAQAAAAGFTKLGL